MIGFTLRVVRLADRDSVGQSVAATAALDHVAGADLKIGLGQHDFRDLFTEIANSFADRVLAANAATYFGGQFFAAVGDEVASRRTLVEFVEDLAKTTILSVATDLDAAEFDASGMKNHLTAGEGLDLGGLLVAIGRAP